MNKNSLTIAIAAAVVVLVGGVAVYGMNQNKSASGHDGMSHSEMEHMHSHSTSNSSSHDAEATNSVTIQDFAFSPKSITVKAGTTVTWTNQDSVKHNVVSDSDGGPDGPLLSKGETYSYTFAKAGTYDYHCQPHPYMKGTVTVTD